MTAPKRIDGFDPVRCWCGVKGDPDDMFADDLDATCGGMGVLHCYCGGDQCVCHNHGEVECDGCEDCVQTYDEDEP